MLKKNTRLKRMVFGKSSGFKTPYFSLKIHENKEGVSRFGFVASKKIDKRATVRNRIKRVLRSCIEGNMSSIKAGYDLLFILRKEAVGKSRQEMCSSVSLVLSQGNLLK